MKLKLFFCIFFICQLHVFVSSEEQGLEITYEEEEKKEYHEIVVTAGKTSQDKYSVPMPVKTIKKEYLEENMFTSMTDMLDSTIGFSSRYEYHSTIYMRGFSGNNILLLQDGCRRTSNTPSGTRANKLGIFNIERVEIVRGPGSVIYGSGALTGIVNIITTDIFKTKGMDLQVDSSYASNSNEKNNSCMFNYNFGNAAFNFGARYRKADNYTFPDGSEAEHSYLEDKDFTSKIGFRPTGKQEIIFSSDIHLGGPWSKAAGFNGKPDLEIYYDQEDTYHFSVNYKIEDFLSLDSVGILAYYDYEKTVNGKKWYSSSSGAVTSDTVTNMKDQYGGGTILIQKKIGNNSISTGCDAYIYRVWIDGSEYSTVAGPDPTYEETESIQGGGTDSLGYYLQDIITFKRVKLVLGARYDIARVSEGANHAESLDNSDAYSDSKLRKALSGNAGVVYNFYRQLFWNFNVGRAFRMPYYNEMYSETYTGKGIITGNPEVEPEYSLNFDTGFKGYLGNFVFEINTFLNFYDDLIQEEPVDPSDSDSGYIYQNIDRARIYGYECEFSYKLVNLLFADSVFIPSAAWTYYVGDDIKGGDYFDFTGSDPLYYVPNSELKANLRFVRSKNNYSWFLNFGYTYAFEQNRVADGDEPYDSYYFCEVESGMEIERFSQLDSLKIYFTVKNITNNEYYLFGDYLPAKGRDFRLTVSANF